MRNFVLCAKLKKNDPRRSYRLDTPVVEADSTILWKKQYLCIKRKAKVPNNIAASILILDNLFGNSDSLCLMWHRDECRPNFMSKERLDRYPDIDANTSKPKHSQSQESSTLNEEVKHNNYCLYRRSQASDTKYLRNIHCVVCCKSTKNGKLSQKSMFNTHSKLQQIAK